MPSMTAYSFGDVVLVQFPFTDQSSTKQRPAIVISSERYNSERPDLVILAVTSRMRETLGHAEHLLTDWSVAGLLKPSVIKPLIATIEKSLVRRVLGQLGSCDLGSLECCIEEIIGHDISSLTQPG